MIGAVVAGGLLLAACGGDDDDEATASEDTASVEPELSPAEGEVGGARAGVEELGVVGSWVGRVDDSEAFVGISVYENRDVMAYVCDGDEISQWFVVEEAGRESFEGSNGDAEIEADLTVDEATGTVTLADGQELEFAAPKATLDSGLYRATDTIDGTDYVGGWVVLPDGEQRGAISSGSNLLPGGILDTANPIATIGTASLQGRLVNPYTLRDVDF